MTPAAVEIRPLARGDAAPLPALRGRGIATRLVDAAEALAATGADEVGIGVGLQPGYDAAQRMYVARGYLPDGRGVTTGGRFAREGEQVVLDDDLVLHLVKHLTPRAARTTP